MGSDGETRRIRAIMDGWHVDPAVLAGLRQAAAGLRKKRREGRMAKRAEKPPWEHDWTTPMGAAILRSQTLLPGIEKGLAEGRFDGPRGKHYRNSFAKVAARALECRMPESERIRWEALKAGLEAAAGRPSMKGNPDTFKPGQAQQTKRGRRV
jgi:hypothetical protein